MLTTRNTLYLLAAVPLFASFASAQTESKNYHQDVKPIVDAYCAGCHSAGNIGPFPLTSFKEVFAKRFMVYDAVASKRMPPWHADPVKEYKYNTSLPDDLQKVITDWIDNGAPEGNALSVGAPIKVERAEIDSFDVETGMSQAFTPDASKGDIYRCFVLDWEAPKDVFLTGYHVTPGNKKIVHHVAIFTATPDVLPKVRDMENEDPEAGYECFGGPYTKGKVLQMPFTGTVAPGNDSFLAPKGSGVEITKGSRLVMQVHYSIHGAASAEAPSDQTRMKLQLSEKALVSGYFFPIMNVFWPIIPDLMKIPAGAVNHEIKHVGKPFGNLELIKIFFAKKLDAKNGVDIFATFPHMHTHGKKLVLNILRDKGEPETIFSVSDWNFHWQGGFSYKNKIAFHPKDRMELKCYFDNTEETLVHDHGPNAESQTPLKDIKWGEGTADEMCIATVFVTAKDALPDQ